MSIDDEQYNKRGPLRLVNNRFSGGDFDVKPVPPFQQRPSGTIKLVAPPARFRNAILHLAVEDFGQNIDEILREMNEKFDSEQQEDCFRCALLRQRLDELGLRFMAGPPDASLICYGYLTMFDSKRLLSRYPELSLLCPEKCDLSTIGELPAAQRSAAWHTRHASAAIVLRNLHRGPGKAMLDIVAYFDVAEDSPWGQESNRLRRAIRSLSMVDVQLSVRDAIVELCNLRDPRNIRDVRRVDDLRRSLAELGLSFVESKNDTNIPRHVVLARPEVILEQYPEFAVLHPMAWHHMCIA